MCQVVRPCAQFRNKWIKKDIMNNDYVEDCDDADHDNFTGAVWQNIPYDFLRQI